MDTAVVRQFLDFFKDFLQICQLDNWPNNDTTELELRNAFLMSQHVVRCLDKLQQKSIISEFVSTLNDDNIPNGLLKTCLQDPPKYILKKIINSSSNISVLDSGFRLFVEMFSEEKLEQCLSDFFLEAASKETLLKNIPTEFSTDTILKLKVELLLAELYMVEDSKPKIREMLSGSSEIIELLIACLLNNNSKYINVVNNITCTIAEVMQSKEIKYRNLWKLIYCLEKKPFIELCLKHNNIFLLLSKALLDCGKLIKENMSSEYFYIDLTYFELKAASQKICTNDHLKMEFLELIMNNESELTFWNNIVL